MTQFDAQDLVAHATQLQGPDWLAADAVLAPVLPLVASRHVAQDWHKAGTFRQHLHGVVRSLTLWRQPDAVRFLGLLHSVYGNSYVDLVKFDRLTERHLLQAAVGADAERLVYLFCTVPRTGFVQHLLTADPADDGSIELKVEGRVWRLAPEEVAAFIVVTLADMAEQWYAWQDEVPLPPRPQRHCAVGGLALAWTHAAYQPQPERPLPPHACAAPSRIGAAAACAAHLRHRRRPLAAT